MPHRTLLKGRGSLVGMGHPAYHPSVRQKDPHRYSKPSQALVVPELVLLYLEHLSDKQLVVAAGVCRAWELAIDVLWRSRWVPLSVLLNKLAPLRREEPDSDPVSHAKQAFYQQWEPRTLDVTFEVAAMSLWGPFVATYAGKVTRLVVDTILDIQSIKLLQNLMHFHGQVMCPRLLAVREDTGHPSRIFTFATVLSPSVKHVEVVGVEAFLKDLQPFLAALCPAVAHLTFQACVWPRCSPLAIMNEASLAGIRSLTIYSLPLSDLHHLEPCKALESLSLLGGPSSLPGPGNGPNYHEITLPSLQRLFIRKTYNLTGVVRQIVAPKLRIMTYETDWPEHKTKGADGMVEEESEIQLSSKSPLLETLTLPFRALKTMVAAFQAYKTMAYLREVHFTHVTTSQSLSDSDIQVIASSLPQVEILRLNFTKPEGPPLASHLGLLTLTRSCRQLRVLGIPIDLYAIPYESRIVEDDCRSWALRQLELCDPGLPQELFEVAEFLLALAPRLVRISPSEMGASHSQVDALFLELSLQRHNILNESPSD